MVKYLMAVFSLETNRIVCDELCNQQFISLVSNASVVSSYHERDEGGNVYSLFLCTNVMPTSLCGSTENMSILYIMNFFSTHWLGGSSN